MPSSETKTVKDRLAEYGTRIPEVLTEAGFAFEKDGETWIVAHPTCEKCTTRVFLQTSWRGYGMDPAAILKADRYTGLKLFVELKDGGFNYPKLIEFLKGELDDKHARHLMENAAEARLLTSAEALFRAVKDLGLPDRLVRNWRDEITAKYGRYPRTLASAEDDGLVHFAFNAEPHEVEPILRFLNEQGILERETGK